MNSPVLGSNPTWTWWTKFVGEVKLLTS